jgi:hypothetical protein
MGKNQKKLTGKERAEYFAQLATRCIELMNDGLTAMQVANELKVAPSFVHKHTRGIIPRKKWGYHGKPPKVNNPWLDPNDEANIYQFWVPSPEEIAEECRKIRNGDVYVRSAAGGKHETSFVSVRREPLNLDIFAKGKRQKSIGSNGYGLRQVFSYSGHLQNSHSAISGSVLSASTQEGTARTECQQDSSTSA